MSRSRGRTEDGSRIDLGRSDRPVLRHGNREMLEVPASDRMLEIVCAAGGSRKGGPRLVAVVDRQWRLRVRAHTDAAETAGQTRALCRCLEKSHRLDNAKVAAAADRLQYRPQKARRVDARSVAPDDLSR